MFYALSLIFQVQNLSFYRVTNKFNDILMLIDSYVNIRTLKDTHFDPG